MEEWARKGERIDDLQHDGLRILQRPGAFRFGTDAVLLADFAAARPGEHVVDFGTGTGILPLLIASRARGTTFDALEIQPDMADMAARSVAMNGLSDRIRVHCADLRDAASLLGHGRTDLLVCNPPYGKAGAGLVNPRQAKALARHEAACTLDEIAQSAAQVLRSGGRMCVVFPVARMLELMDCARAHRLEPKRMRLVYARADKAPKLMLLECARNVRPLLRVEPPLLMEGEDGAPTAEVRRIYRMD